MQEYEKVVKRREPHLLLDVREKVEYQICHLPHSRSIPPSPITHIHTHWSSGGVPLSPH